MGLKVGILGLPNVGKSSLFSALTAQEVLVENRPFSTINPNLGVVKFLDPRLSTLSEMVKPKKTTYSTIEFLDIAGLVKGASKGEGLGNKFLENLRTTDAIVLVARAFKNPNILSVNEQIDPVIEAETVLYELIYSDLEQIENIKRKLKSNDQKKVILDRLYQHLLKSNLISSLSLSSEEKKEIRSYSFLTEKPLVFLANIDDSPNSKLYQEALRKYSDSMNASFLSLNIKLEKEISTLPEADQKEFLKMMNRKESSLSILVEAVFRKLNLRTFFTVGPEEVRAWVFHHGWTASRCARCIHSDIEKGFIKAKIVKYQDFLKYGDYKLLQEKGLVSLEGRNYLIQDSDIVRFEFNI